MHLTRAACLPFASVHRTSAYICMQKTSLPAVLPLGCSPELQAKVWGEGAGGTPITSMLSRSNRLSMLMGACAVLLTRMSTSFSVRSTTCAKAPLQIAQGAAITQGEHSALTGQQHVTALKLVWLLIECLRWLLQSSNVRKLTRLKATNMLVYSTKKLIRWKHSSNNRTVNTGRHENYTNDIHSARP